MFEFLAKLFLLGFLLFLIVGLIILLIKIRLLDKDIEKIVKDIVDIVFLDKKTKIELDANELQLKPTEGSK